MRALALTILISAAGPLAAEPFLDLPVVCGLKAREGHRGTDFALPDMEAMRSGAAVIAAAPGVVEAVRDGVPDRVMTTETAGAIADVECGNAVRIGHANGLKTLYCHLQPGDVLHLRAEGPAGEIFSRKVRIDEDRAQLFRAYGRRAPDPGWPPGAYRGDARLTRSDTLIGTRQAYIEVSAD